MSENEVFHACYLKEAPVKILMRFLKDDKDYESQIMEQSEAFFEKYGVYPNGLVLNHDTFKRWYSTAEQSGQPIEEIEEVISDETQDIICEFKASSIPGGTAFATPKYEMLIIYNSDYQDKVYQLFYSDSFISGDEEFSYPVINMEKTGKNIKELASAKNISVQEIQKVCGLGSFQAVYKWFNGQTVPTIDNLAILANLLDVSIDDLIVVDNRKI